MSHNHIFSDVEKQTTPQPITGLEMGIELMPEMPVNEAIETVQAAESLGYAYAVIADEGFMHDPYILLGVLARQTRKIKLGPVTNGYTRHPAITASALASLQEMSQGRALLTLVAGGSMVLRPMGIPRQAPLAVVRETIQILRLLWSGESVNWEGQRYSLDGAKLAMGQQQIPIWLAARGPHMLKLAGEVAEAVVLMGKSDLGPALTLVEQSSSARLDKPKRVYLDRLVYKPELMREAAVLYAYSLIDTPPRMLSNLGIDEALYLAIRETLEDQGAEAASKLITEEMIRRLQIAGTPEECGQLLNALREEHQLDVFLLDIVSSGLRKNVRLMTESYTILNSAINRR